MSTVARSSAQQMTQPQLSRAVRSAGLALLVDPDTALNQVPVAWRPKSHAALAYSFPDAWDPSVHTLTRDDELAYVRYVLQLQVAAGATLLVAPYHYGGGVDDVVRRFDLRLVQRAAEAFETMRLAEGDPGPFPIRRELYAAILIDLEILTKPLERAALIASYVQLPVDGFLVKVIDLAEESSLETIDAASEFLLGLQTDAERPVVMVGGKNLGAPLLGTGLAAQMIGVGEGEVVRFPPAPRSVKRRRRPVFHQIAMRSVDPLSPDINVRRRAELLFDASPCECGHHAATEIPAHGFPRAAHTFSQRAELALWLSSGSVAARRRELYGRHEEARRLALECGLTAPPPAEAVVRAGTRVAGRAGRTADGKRI